MNEPSVQLTAARSCKWRATHRPASRSKRRVGARQRATADGPLSRTRSKDGERPIDARYSSTYHITPEELSILRSRVLDLRERTDRICKEKLGLPPNPPKERQPTGRALGKAEGKLEGRAQSVLDALKLRGIDVPEDVRDRILACTDLAVLDGWFARSLSVQEASDLFDEPGTPKA